MTAESIARTTKNAALSQTSRATGQLATRLEHAWQIRNAKVARADAEYRATVKRLATDEAEPPAAQDAINDDDAAQPPTAAPSETPEANNTLSEADLA